MTSSYLNLSTTPTHSVKDTLGALLVGALVTMTIYGITTLQAYFYYVTFPKDGLKMRVLAISIWLLDTLHAILMCHSVHMYLIDDYGDMTVLARGNWALYASMLVNVTLAFVVQCFFTYRIFRLCSLRRRWYISGPIGLSVVCHFVFGTITVIMFLLQIEFIKIRQLSWVTGPFAGFTLLSDVAIAAALCILLNGNRTEYQDTNTLINRLMLFAINRCILTSLVTIAEFIIFTTLPNTFYTFAVDFVIGKLYSNSLLAVLNSRVTLYPQAVEFYTTELTAQFHMTSETSNNDMNSQIRTQEREDIDTEKRHFP